MIRQDFPRLQPYKTTAEATIEISTSPDQDFTLQILIGKQPRFSTFPHIAQDQPNSFEDDMVLDDIPPPTDPQLAQVPRFLTCAYVFIFNMLKFSNFNSSMDPFAIASAVSAFAIAQDTRDHKLSQFMSVAHITQELVRNRPAIDRSNKINHIGST